MKKVNTITEVESLIKFQERVLYNGIPSDNKSYTTEMIQKELMFNEIFLKNTDEMFQKYDCTNIRETYRELLIRYNSNVKRICNELFKVNSDYTFSKESSFERRLNSTVALNGRIDVSSISNFEFVDGIYYVFSNPSVLENKLSIVKVDKSVFEKPLRNEKMFWKTDDCIIEYIKNLFNVDVMEVKITTKNGKVSKIEIYNSNEFIIRYLIQYLKQTDKASSSITVYYNPFLFIDDIKLMCKEMNISEPKINKQSLPLFDLNNLNDDILVEYPLDSFDSYLALLSMAANNKETKSISLTLYRVGFNPSIFNILKKARLNGITVNVNIELLASGEWINSFLFDEMYKIGINVTAYKNGILKVHSKLTLIEFKNGKSIAQIGTGNYHTETTLQYTDLSLITADIEICNMVKDIFNLFNMTLEDEELKPSDDLIVTGIKNSNIDILLDLIDQQAELGEDGYIFFKCNSLSSRLIICKLNEAAAKGCKINLIVRGICTWIPSCDNVMIRSIVWDKLEHSRVYSFGKINPIAYIGSLDLVDRKIMRRVETLVKIKSPRILLQLIHYLNRYLTNNSNTWIMDKYGIYNLKED